MDELVRFGCDYRRADQIGQYNVNLAGDIRGEDCVANSRINKH